MNNFQGNNDAKKKFNSSTHCVFSANRVSSEYLIAAHYKLTRASLEQDPRAECARFLAQSGDAELHLVDASLGNFHVGGGDRDAQWRVCRATRCLSSRGRKRNIEFAHERRCLGRRDGVANTIVLVRVAIIPTLRRNNAACYNESYSRAGANWP